MLWTKFAYFCGWRRSVFCLFVCCCRFLLLLQNQHISKLSLHPPPLPRPSADPSPYSHYTFGCDTAAEKNICSAFTTHPASNPHHHHHHPTPIPFFFTNSVDTGSRKDTVCRPHASPTQSLSGGGLAACVYVTANSSWLSAELWVTTRLINGEKKEKHQRKWSRHP